VGEVETIADELWEDVGIEDDDYVDDGRKGYGRPEDEWFVTNLGSLWNFCLICLERCITRLRGASKPRGREY